MKLCIASNAVRHYETARLMALVQPMKPLSL